MTESMFESLASQLPERLVPEFVMPAVNAPVALFRGEMMLQDQGTVLGTVTGELRIRWRPDLKIEFEGQFDGAGDPMAVDRAINLVAHAVHLDAPAMVANRNRLPFRAWLDGLDARAHPNVVAVALANKLVRIAWAVLTRNEPYRTPALTAA